MKTVEKIRKDKRRWERDSDEETNDQQFMIEEKDNRENNL